MKKYFLINFSKMNYFLLFISVHLYQLYIYIYYIVCVSVYAKFVKMNIVYEDIVYVFRFYS